MGSFLDIRLLGAPRIERDGSPVSTDTRKAIALLAYLVVTGEPQQRDRLAALLWPDSGQAHARAALRRTLSSLNKALEGRGLVVHRESIGLDADEDAEIDLVEFRRLLDAARTHPHAVDDACSECRERLLRAVDLYRGDLLEGFTLRDSSAFDD
jgi:DNA-binding SARP family transcriptional activator